MVKGVMGDPPLFEDLSSNNSYTDFLGARSLIAATIIGKRLKIYQYIFLLIF
jgi:hypothetical protein